MSATSVSSSAPRRRRRLNFRKLAAWLVSRVTSGRADLWLVITFAVVHALLWTRILIDLKAAQDVHMDVAEAFAWGQKFQLGYGKHPPLTGWIAGLVNAATTSVDWIRTHQADVSVLLFLAAGMIGVFILVVCPAEQGDEMMRLAKNIAELGTFANPFSVLATGPTAVTPPLYPFMLAGFMKLLRVSSWPVAAAVLVSILVNAITASLLPRISVVFYGDAVPGVIASILWLAVMPVMPGWDTSYTVMGLIFFCILTSSFEDLDRSNEARLAARWPVRRVTLIRRMRRSDGRG